MRHHSSLLLLLIACHTGETVGDDPREVRDIEPYVPVDASPTLEGSRTRSGALVLSDDASWTYVVDTDNEAILAFDMRPGSVTSGSARSLSLPGEPTRAVRAGGFLFVTLRGSGEVARIAETPEGLVVERTAYVGAEPYDVVASPTRAVVYVSLSMEDAVVALDAETLAPLRRWTVDGEPRWMAARDIDGEDEVFVASARGSRITRLSGSSDAVARLTLPEQSIRTTCGRHPMSSRITGELALAPEGDHLYVAALYADTTLEEGDGAAGDARDGSHDTGGFGGHPCDPNGNTGGPSGTPDSPSGGGLYGGSVDGASPGAISRFNPMVVDLSLSDGSPQAFVVGTIRARDTDGLGEVARGVVTGLEVYDGFGMRQVVATLETSSALVAISTDVVLDDVAPGVHDAMRSALRSGRGALSPRAGAVGQEDLRAWSWIDRVVQVWGPVAVTPDPGLIDMGPTNTFAAPPSRLSDAVLAGRALFFSADAPQMAAVGTGVSCSACHADGRNDGFTWRFADFDRQTPSLAGVVSETAPVTWTGEVADVATEAHLTSSLRMGGSGVSRAEAAQIAAYVDSTRRTMKPAPSAEEQALIAEGEVVFRLPSVGCVACHSGSNGTNNATVSLFGLDAVNVPPLAGIAATAPYLHDGSAATLRDVLERSRDGSMGDTSGLSERQMLALETYLRFY
ncbi:MAG TPA: hypothetical protein PKA64_15680 [Myxococcota bacterium]|nr:hypothetical protein [Myxococcota bacterium]